MLKKTMNYIFILKKEKIDKDIFILKLKIVYNYIFDFKNC